MGRWPAFYATEHNVLDLVQVCRRARMTWDEAEQFLQKNGIKMSRSNYFATKRFLEDSIEQRIQYIATTEYADMHLQLLDMAKDMFTRLQQMSLKATEKDDYKMELKVYEETRQNIELIKQLYNSNTIVGGVKKFVDTKIREAEEAKSRANMKPTDWTQTDNDDTKEPE